MIAAVNLAPFMIAGTIAVLVVVAFVLMLPVRGRAARLEADDAEAARRRIAAIAAMPAPDELPRARDVTRAERRRFTYRRHPIAHKRAGRNI